MTIAIGGAIVCLAQPPGPSDAGTTAPDFEELPELKASEILKPEVLKGPNYTVREPVPTSSGMNQFTIDSEFGVFQADGNEMLLQRVKEIYMIAKLKDVSRTDQFEQSLVTAAKGPYNAAKNVVKDYAAWTSGAAAFSGEVQKLAGESGGHKPMLVVISGQMSPRLQQELQTRGITAHDRFGPGPLK